jgi:hypothetical protein
MLECGNVGMWESVPLRIRKIEMMKFKKGDKVKFLNTIGGGVVTRVGGNSMVYVEIEDGFEIPVMASDLVGVADAVSRGGRMFISEPSAVEVERRPVTEVRHERQLSMATGSYPGKPLDAGVYLLFRPMDQRILTMGDLEVLLVNHTSYPILAQLFLGNPGDYSLQGHHILTAQRSVILSQISRNAIGTWLQGVVQCLTRPPQAKQLILPVHASFNIASSRFHRAQEYELTSLDPHAVIAVLLKQASTLKYAGQAGKGDTFPAGPGDTVTKAAKGAPVEEKGVKAIPQETFISKHLNAKGYAVVDLHLHTLLPERWDMSPMEALRYQTGYFKKALESAIVERVPRMVVVHGVGSGVLKAEILRMAEETTGAHTWDAPIKEYGLGATVIEFFHTKNEQLRADLK